MALLFIDSFDHYIAADGGLKGWTYSGGTITAGVGRHGTAGLNVSNTNFYGQCTLPAVVTGTVVVGFSFQTSQLHNSGLVSLMDSISPTGTTVHISISLNSMGSIEVRRGVGGTLLATGTIQLVAGANYYIEVKANIHDSTGSVIVRVNGVVDVNISGVDTRNGGNAEVAIVRLGWSATGFAPTQYFDDLYVCDTSGSAPNNDFLGDVRVQTLLPSGNGNSSVLVGSDGNSTDNYLLVDEAAPNGDTDYVESSTVGDKDTYAYGNLTPTAGTVYGIQVISHARKTDAGTRSIKNIVRLSGTEEGSPANLTLGTSYAMHREIRETKPGGGAWSISDVNNVEVGVEVTQ